MDELKKKGYDSENGTAYKPMGVNRLEKGFDGENGTPYEPAGANPFGTNDFSSAENSTQHEFGSSPQEEQFKNTGYHDEKRFKEEIQRKNVTDKEYYENDGTGSGGNQNFYQQTAPQYTQQENTQNSQQYGQPFSQVNNQQNTQQYDQPFSQQYRNQPFNGGFQYAQGNTAVAVKPKDSGVAIASLIIALVNMLFFKNLLSIITVPLCVILSIICLANKKDGKGFAIASLVVSVISCVVMISAIAVCVKLYPDFKYFIENEEQIVSDFREYGTIPEQFEKYESPRFKKYWKAVGCDNFKEFFEIFIERYRSGSDSNPYHNDSDDDEEETSREDSPVMV